MANSSFLGRFIFFAFVFVGGFVIIKCIKYGVVRVLEGEKYNYDNKLKYHLMKPLYIPVSPLAK